MIPHVNVKMLKFYVNFFYLIFKILILAIDKTWCHKSYFTFSIFLFDGLNNLSNFLKYVYFIWYVINASIYNEHVKVFYE